METEKEGTREQYNFAHYASTAATFGNSTRFIKYIHGGVVNQLS